MQTSLDANRLLALVDDGIDAGTYYIPWAKEYFGEQNLSQGVDNLLMAFSHFSRPSLRIHNRIVNDIRRGAEEWSIAFLVHIDADFSRPQRLMETQDRPFTHLNIKPDPDHSAFINVYEDDKHVQTYEMLNRPEQWQAFIKWLWEYGNDRLICQAAIVARRKGEAPPDTWIRCSY